jgi:hypothetical protein
LHFKGSTTKYTRYVRRHLISSRFFGFNSVGYTVNIVDLTRAEVADSFVAYDPVMSPDQRWIASRHFWAPQSQIQVREEYLLYDLDVGSAANRHNVTPYTTDAVGWAMYPAFPDNAPADLLDIPEASIHLWRSSSFVWAPDSQSLVFADSVGDKLSLVLILIRNGKPQAYLHRVSSAEACIRAGGSNRYIVLQDASINPLSGGGFRITARLEDPRDDASCQPRQLSLALSDFQPAKVEVYPHRKLKTPTGIPYRPPK